MQVAQTIIKQLGGNKFAAMTGAKQFVGGDKFVQFSIGRGARGGINKVKVTLGDNDLYTVEFFKLSSVCIKELGKVENVYADQLQRVFTEQTGFDTHL